MGHKGVVHNCIIFYMLKSIAWQNDSSKGSQSKLAFQIQIINQPFIFNLIFFSTYSFSPCSIQTVCFS